MASKWKCAECGNENDASLLVCSQCGLKHPSAKASAVKKRTQITSAKSEKRAEYSPLKESERFVEYFDNAIKGGKA